MRITSRVIAENWTAVRGGMAVALCWAVFDIWRSSMFRLIKLALWGLVGYALYELYQGFKEGGQGQQSGFGGRMGEESGRGMNMTGGGGGGDTRAEEAGGMSSGQKVGRGGVGR